MKKVKPLIPVLALLPIFLFFRKSFFLKGSIALGFDQNVYGTVSRQIAHGSILYKDVWACKPPMIYFINILSNAMPFRSLEFTLGIISLFVLFYIGKKLSQNSIVILGLLVGFTTIFFNKHLYGSGAYTEEYGAQFLIFSVASMIGYRNSSNIKLIFASGLFAALAVMCKEVFVLSSIPWIALMLFEKNFKGMLYYSIGVLLACFPFAIYFVSNAAINDLYQTFVYNLQYAQFLNISILVKVQTGIRAYLDFFSSFGTWVPFLPALGLLTFKTESRVLKKIVLVFYVQFVFDFLGVCMSGYGFGHYFLQLVFSFCILSFTGLSASIALIQKPIFKRVSWVGLSIFIAFMFHSINTNGVKSVKSQEIQAIEIITDQFINDGSTIYVDDVLLSSIYSANNYSTSYIPVPVFHYFMVPDRYRESRIHRFVESLQRNPSDYIITSSAAATTDMFPELTDLKTNRYHLIYSGDSTVKNIKIWQLTHKNSNGVVAKVMPNTE